MTIWWAGPMMPVHTGAAILGAFQRRGYTTVGLDPWVQPWSIRQLDRATKDDVLIADRGGGLPPEAVYAFPGLTVYHSPEALEVPGWPDAHTKQRTTELRTAGPAFRVIVAHDEHSLDAIRRLFPEEQVYPTPIRIGIDPQRIYDIQVDRDLPVVFIGSMSPHRQQVMAEMTSEGIRPAVAQGWGPGLREVLSRAQICLNLHFANSPNTEQRLIEAGFCGAYVVTEPISATGDWTSLISSGATPEELTQLCLTALADPAKLGRRAKRWRRHCLQHGTIDRMADDFLTLIQERA